MKRIVCLLLSVFLLMQSTFAISNLPNPTAAFFVNDFANVIDAEDENEIFNMAKLLYESSGNSTQVVVVTIDSLNGNSIEEYANELFNEWEIGSKENDDGVLLLLAVQDSESRIEVGYGLEGVLTDGKTGRLQDEYMIPYYRDNDFSEGLRCGVETIISVLNGKALENIVDDGYNSSEKNKEDKIQLEDIMPGIFFIVCIIVYSYVFIGTPNKVKICEKCKGKKFKYKKVRRGNHIYTYSTCLTCGKEYTKYTIVPDSSYSGSYTSSRSYSSSRSSFGGGSSFRGGGGRSGGGGSSRKF